MPNLIDVNIATDGYKSSLHGKLLIGSSRREGWSWSEQKSACKSSRARKVLLLNEVRVYWFIGGKRKGSCRGTCPIIRAVRLSGRLATVSFRFPSFWTRNRDGILTSCDVVRVAAFPHGEDVQRLMKVMSFPLTCVPG